MNIRYRVTLSSEEHAQLAALVSGGKAAVRKIKRAQILLAAASGSTDGAIAANVGVGTSAVYRTKQRFVEEGSDETIPRRLAEADLRPWQKKMWRVHRLDAEYVARMKDVRRSEHDPLGWTPGPAARLIRAARSYSAGLWSPRAECILCWL